MGSRFPAHQLSNGLYVSGLPEQPKEKIQTMSSTAVPYTGGDIKKSGELGRMFDIPVDSHKSRKSGPLGNAPSRSGSFAAPSSHSGPVSSGMPGSGSMKKSYSGPLSKHGEPLKKTSGPQSGGVTPGSRQNSGPQPPILPATGLITSGPISSGPLNSSGAPRKVSGPLDSTGSFKIRSSSAGNNQAVTSLGQDDNYSFIWNLPRAILWAVGLLFVMGFIAGAFILAAVHNAVLLIMVAVLFCNVAALFLWNSCWGRRAVIGYIEDFPDSDLRNAANGDYIKVSGVVTCGNVPLQSSFQRVPRCIYTSTSLYEYMGWDSKSSNATQRRFTWGLRFAEKHVVDFYISDHISGLRAIVKAGCGATVSAYVDENVTVDVDPRDKEHSLDFLRWLQEKNVPSEDRVLRLKEGYIKEGSAVSVMGVVQRNESVLMIVPPGEAVSTGFQWTKCVFPGNLDGIVIMCEDASDEDAIAV